MKIMLGLVLAGILNCHQAPATVSGAHTGVGASAAAPLPISNSDVAWDGSDLGIIAQIPKSAVLNLLDAPDCSAPALVAALLDPDRYVVAHVLLTDLLNEPWRGDGGAWNGLRVQLYADGKTGFERNDLQKLHEIWVMKLTSGSLT